MTRKYSFKRLGSDDAGYTFYRLTTRRTYFALRLHDESNWHVWTDAGWVHLVDTSNKKLVQRLVAQVHGC